MDVVIDWLRTPIIFGMPTWGILFFVIGAIVEARLGRSSDPRFRSLAQAIAVAVMAAAKPLLGRIPGLSGLMPALFAVLVPDTANKCDCCEGSGIKKVQTDGPVP
jgi:hypothetical protein